MNAKELFEQYCKEEGFDSGDQTMWFNGGMEDFCEWLLQQVAERLKGLPIINGYEEDDSQNWMVLVEYPHIAAFIHELENPGK